MSEPLRRSVHEDYADDELRRWPGVSWGRRHRSKHMALVLTYQGVTRFVTYPLTSSDSARGPQNHVGDIRRTLRELGATRLEVVKAQAQPKRRKRTVAEEPISIPPRDKTRLDHDPFAALAGFRFPEPEPPDPPAPTPSFIARTLAKLSSIFKR